MQFSPQTQTVPAYSVHLDAMRALAALVVFAGHARFMFISHASQAKAAVASAISAVGSAPEKVTWGHQAVIVFFVLSGYLVGGSVLRDLKLQRWSWQKYLTLRLTRLWVVLFPALIAGFFWDHLGSTHFAGLNTIYNHLEGVSASMPSLADRLKPAVFFGNLFFLQTIRVDFFGSNNALWSLANEFWYYLAFPCMILALSPRRSILSRCLYGVALITGLRFVGLSISADYLIWLAGVGAYVLPCRIPEKWQVPLFSFSVFILGGTCLWVRRAKLPENIADGCLGVAFFLVLYCALHRRQTARAGLYQSVARFISRMSYTLYLTHVPALTILCAYLLETGPKWSPSLVNGFRFFGVLSLVFAYACFLYGCFEANTTKIRSLVQSWWSISLRQAGRSFSQ